MKNIRFVQLFTILFCLLMEIRLLFTRKIRECFMFFYRFSRWLVILFFIMLRLLRLFCSMRSLSFIFGLTNFRMALLRFFFFGGLILSIYFLVLMTLCLRLNGVLNLINYAICQSARHNNNIDFFIICTRNEHFFLLLHSISTFFTRMIIWMFACSHLNIFFHLVYIWVILGAFFSFLFSLLNYVCIIHLLNILLMCFSFDLWRHISLRLFHYFLTLFLIQRFLWLFSWQMAVSFIFFDISLKRLGWLSFNFFFSSMILWHFHLGLGFCPIIFFLGSYLLRCRLLANPRFIPSSLVFHTTLLSLDLDSTREIRVVFEMVFILESLNLLGHVTELLLEAMYFLKERLHSRVNFLLN